MDVTKIIKRPFQIRIPGGWEKHYFETSEDMIVNIIQSLETTGYRKLPGGLILQFGQGLARFVGGASGYVSERDVVFPVAFQSRAYFIIPSCNNITAYPSGSQPGSGGYKTGCKLLFRSTGGADSEYQWFAIGY
ncbi:hypothetical protein [Clostridium sp. KNHs214]|uniref:gp53-like domain-containing protein n=1 Tax=Clostridium sp. KNHs214 TaxID=1540257 RepID=UPI0005555646|nr:hypothetical protein [Clostridium sp. KNHs214]